jgi:hypothetical protein
VLLVNAWDFAPLAAAGAVSALPVGTLAGAPVGRRVAAWQAGAAGAVLLALGLAGLALLPSADVAWIVAALAFCGLGIGMALAALTRAVFRDAPRPLQTAGWTVAVRHAGLVLGLLLATPLLAHGLSSGVHRAELVGTGLVLDAPLSTPTKVSLAIDLARTLQSSPRGKVPDFTTQFRRRIEAGGPRDVLVSVNDRLDDTVRGIVTRSFRGAFLLCALLALAAVAPTALLRRSP